MREILFKAKRTGNGEWVEGDLRQDKDIEKAYISGWDYYTTEGGLEREPFEYEINPETLCQYTGLKDKNDKRIWENDILFIIEQMASDTYSNGRLVNSSHWTNKSYFKVEYTPGGLMNTQRYSHSSQIECINVGNVFDNPELLEQDGG